MRSSKELKKPLRTVKLVLGFDGTRYEGWQSQLNGKTLQEVFEKILKKIFGAATPVTGSSRTDSGVHAKGFVAHFKTHSKLGDKDIQKALNFYLPKDVVVFSVKTVHSAFHARFDAKSKIYQYEIWNGPTRPLFEAPYVLFYPQRLDLKAMKRAAALFKGKHDFSAFCTLESADKNAVRTIKRISVLKDKELIRILIEADGFLRYMVRVIVGTLLEVGRGKIKPETVRAALKSKDRKLAGPTAKARGLTLINVRY